MKCGEKCASVAYKEAARSQYKLCTGSSYRRGGIHEAVGRGREPDILFDENLRGWSQPQLVCLKLLSRGERCQTRGKGSGAGDSCFVGVSFGGVTRGGHRRIKLCTVVR